jgi:DNA-binding transcriptional ArsR family regulator
VEAVLQAIGAPKRREILRLVRRRERSAGEIHRALGGLTFGAVSQHLGVLEAAGLVSVRRAGRSRLYVARPAGLAPLRRWLEAMWDDALARLAQQAEAEEASGGEPRAAEGPRGAGRGKSKRGRQR